MISFKDMIIKMKTVNFYECFMFLFFFFFFNKWSQYFFPIQNILREQIGNFIYKKYLTIMHASFLFFHNGRYIWRSSSVVEV
jgi:hypothetical protein